MITTLTLSPAFDIHVNIEKFNIGRENLARDIRRDVGGKGINISRALIENGVECDTVVLVGRENGADFVRGLSGVGIEAKVLECDGHIRENITVHADTGEETRLSFRGFSCGGEMLDKILPLIGVGDTVTFTGSLPDGISVEQTERFLLSLKAAGLRLVIDSKSVTLPMLEKIKPWLIKPNAEECEAYFGAISEKELYDVALRLNANGIENVMVSLGGGGAILAVGGRVYRAYAPKINVVSTIGAGDSAIAGFVSSECEVTERLKNAVAYGSAACLKAGTNPPRKSDIERLKREITIKEIL